jgi:hypothetical protein
MNRIRRGLLALVLLLAAVPAFAAPAAGQAEIDALIARVAQARDVVFIRNGSEYTAVQAANHLRRKLRAAGDRIHTAEEFIDGVGTRSSLTGTVYRVRLPGGRELESATWLRQLLQEIRARRLSTPPAAAAAARSPTRAGR